MAHGYMRDFDEDRGDERQRWRDEDRERGWHDQGRDRGDWRGNEPDSNDRNRSFMLGNRERSDWERAPRNFSSRQDDHYRSWRDKQMQALDRDYEDYCREREQQFHSDFDTWRQNRQRQGLRVGSGLEQGSGPDEGMFTPETTAVGNTMTTSETHVPQSTTEPEDVATLGTTLGRKR